MMKLSLFKKTMLAAMQVMKGKAVTLQTEQLARR